MSGTALDIKEREVVKSLNDPVCELLLINGGRLAELSQVLINYKDGDYAEFKPKKRKTTSKFLITPKEQRLIKTIQNDIVGNSSTLEAVKKKIQRHFETLKATTGLKEFHPHRLRKTCATQLDRLGVSASTIKQVLNHKNISTTFKNYIAPTDDDVFEAKMTSSEFITADGMTIHELRNLVYRLLKANRRLELENEDLKSKHEDYK